MLISFDRVFLVCSLRRVLFFEVSKISPEAQEALTNWLEADYRLYRFGYVDV